MRRSGAFAALAALALASPLAATAASEPLVALWNERVVLSGSADVGIFGGGVNSVTPDDGFKLWDARFFVDAELGEDLRLGDTLILRNVGFTFEWNLVRLGMLFNDVGLAYVDFEGLGGSPWLNVRLGRFQIPFGEAYKRYSQGYAERPFVYDTLGGPWWWDEGLLVHGASPGNRLGYVASITNGDNDFNGNFSLGTQLTGKLWAQPHPWVYLSASGLWTNELGDQDGALWLGQGWARPFGSGTPPFIVNVVDGVVVPDDPDGLGSTWAVGTDLVLTPHEDVRLWFAWGRYDIESRGAAIYHRTLSYLIGEAVLGGGLVSPVLRPFYLGLRVEGIGTGNDGRGYLLDVRYTAAFGYNMESFVGYSTVLGWRLGRFVTLRAEYSHRDVDLVRGAAALVPAGSNKVDVYGFDVGIQF